MQAYKSLCFFQQLVSHFVLSHFMFLCNPFVNTDAISEKCIWNVYPSHRTKSDAAFWKAHVCTFLFCLGSDFNRRRFVTYHSTHLHSMMSSSIPTKPSKTCLHKTFPATASEFYVNICHWSCYIINVNIQNIRSQFSYNFISTVKRCHWEKMMQLIKMNVGWEVKIEIIPHAFLLPLVTFVLEGLFRQ